MEALQVEPGDVVVIGDNIELDVMNPKSLGMRAIHIDKDHSGNEKIADATVKDVLEAMNVVESWMNL